MDPATRLLRGTTCSVLGEAARNLGPAEPAATVVADSGTENVNREVDSLLSLHHLRRILAQVEVAYSNSMIEAWWRSLKHNWLFLNRLDSLAAVERLIGFYVAQHNSVMPHPAFAGQTPDEMYSGTATTLPADLANAGRLARAERLRRNREIECEGCSVPLLRREPTDPVANPSVVSGVLHLRQPDS